MWFKSIYTVYLLDEAKGGDCQVDENHQPIFWTEGYAYKSNNESILYKTSFNKLPTVIPHELGHCLSLGHSFYIELPFVSRHVDFTSNWDTNIIRNDDYVGAVSSTFDNIMDYGYKNSKYQHKSFTKHQWDNMKTKVRNLQGSTSLFSNIYILTNLLTREELQQWGYQIRINPNTG